MSQWEIRIIQGEDVTAYRDLRVHALRKFPHCFGESEDELIASSISDLYARVQARSSFPEQFTLGAFEGDKLIGTVSLRRETRTKYRHRAFIWGLFVSAKKERRAIGEALVSALIRYAKLIDGLEQIDVQVESNTAHDIDVYTALRFVKTGTHPRFIRLGRNLYHDVDFYRLDLADTRPDPGKIEEQ